MYIFFNILFLRINCWSLFVFLVNIVILEVIVILVLNVFEVIGG